MCFEKKLIITFRREVPIFEEKLWNSICLVYVPVNFAHFLRLVLTSTSAKKTSVFSKNILKNALRTVLVNLHSLITFRLTWMVGQSEMALSKFHEIFCQTWANKFEMVPFKTFFQVFFWHYVGKIFISRTCDH